MTFPGVQQIVSGQFTFSHGIGPSVATLEIAPQEELILVDGTLQISFGDVLLRFPNCRVNSPSIRNGLDGRVMSFQIQDRRWKWQYGEVYGRYNIKKADGEIDELRSLEKTPQELAEILLKAMNETGFDVAALPTKDWRPTCIWDGNNPAQELANLCDLLGCRVVLGLNNRVKIVKTGSGKELPEDLSRRTRNYGLSITGYPDSLKVVCAPTLFQTKLRLEAVGLDCDGRIKPVNDLTYKPSDSTTGGKSWKHAYPDNFSGITNKADRRLALRTVWRWYRIKSQPNGKLAPPGYPAKEASKVTSIHQLLPIRGQLLEQKLDQQRDAHDLNTQHYLPAYVEGIFRERHFGWASDNLLFTDIRRKATKDSKGNTTIGTRYVGGFSIDEERGIVEFSDWVVKRSGTDDTSGYEEAELYLVCSYSCANENHEPYRFGHERQLVGKGQKQNTGPRVIPAADLYETHIAVYGDDGKEVKSTKANTDELNGWTGELLNAAQAEYQIPATGEAEYAGILEIDLDGSIQQVGWSVGPGGAITRASTNTEFDLAVPDYHKLREQQKVASLFGQMYRDPVIRGAY